MRPIEQWIKDTRRTLSAQKNSRKTKAVVADEDFESVVLSTKDNAHFDSCITKSGGCDEEDLMAKYRLQSIITECSDNQITEARNILDVWSTAIEVEEIRDDQRWVRNIEQQLASADNALGKPVKGDADKALMQKMNKEIAKTAVYHPQQLFDHHLNDLGDESCRKIKESVDKCDETIKRAKLCLMQSPVNVKSKRVIQPEKQDSEKEENVKQQESEDKRRKEQQQQQQENEEKQRKELERIMKRQKRLSECEQKIEQEQKMKRLQLLHKSIVGWHLLIRNYQTTLTNTLLLKEWRQTNSIFNHWRIRSRNAANERQQRLLVAQREHEESLTRLGVLVMTKKVLVGVWRKWYARFQLKREERTLENYRRMRQEKIKEFIAHKKAIIITVKELKEEEPQVKQVEEVKQLEESKEEGLQVKQVEELKQPEESLEKAPVEKSKDLNKIKSKAKPISRADSVFVERMQKREQERKQRKEEAEQRRLERVKQQAKQKEEQEQKQREEEEEMRRQEQERQKALKQQLEEEQLQKEKDKQRKLNDLQTAKQHYQLRGLVYHQTWCRWRQKRDNGLLQYLKAMQFNANSRKRLAFNQIVRLKDQKDNERTLKANQIAETNTIKRVFDNWQLQFWKERSKVIELNARAHKWMETRVFSKWKQSVCEKRERAIIYERHLELRCNSSSNVHDKWLLVECWRRWKVQREHKKEVKWRKYRAECLRKRAQELLLTSRLSKPLIAQVCNNI